MGFHSTSRKGLAALCVLAPVIGLGYYAADPENLHFSTNLHFASEAEAHTRESASSSHARMAPTLRETHMPALGRGAARLFASGKKGPRADRYEEVAQTSVKEKRPVRLASLQPSDGDITGSLPPARGHRAAIERSGKSDRLLPPAEPPAASVPGLPHSGPSSALFVASLFSPQSTGFPGIGEGYGLETTLLRPPGPAKLPRGLQFKGETEKEYQGRQRRCLATAIYFEARGEPIRGQLAVAQVVMNRVRSSIYPDTVCGVVFQGQWQRKGCQFSFACDGRADVPREKEQWTLANKLAKRVLDGKVWLEDVGHATHYHATYVRPAWRRQLDHVKRVGRHIFYRVRQEQIEDVLTGQENQEQGLALAKSG